MSSNGPLPETPLSTPEPIVFGTKAAGIQHGSSAQTEIILSRRIREQLSRLVTAFEASTGADVAEQFAIKTDRSARIFLQAGSTTVELKKKNKARRLAEETLASFTPNPLQRFTRDQTMALSIDGAGIALIRQ